MGPYGDKDLIDEILTRVNSEGGHVELTEEISFKNTAIKVTNIYKNGDIKYNRTDDVAAAVPKKSNLNGINNRVLDKILAVLKKGKFI